MIFTAIIHRYRMTGGLQANSNQKVIIGKCESVAIEAIGYVHES